MTVSHRVCSFVLILLAGAAVASATPQLARQFRVDCSYCHSSPPRLNARGLAFVASGYRFPEGTVQISRTLPLAVWNTVDAEWRHSANLSKAFPSRVELISAGAIAGCNGHLPFGPPAFRQVLRLQIEQRVQSRSHTTTFALSHVF